MRKSQRLPTADEITSRMSQGMTLRNIALELGYSPGGWVNIYRSLRRLGIPRPGSATDVLRRTIDSLTVTQASIVDGSLLGDGSIPPLRRRYRNHHLQFVHSESQESYGWWKMGMLAPFALPPNLQPAYRYGHKPGDLPQSDRHNIHFATITHPVFKLYRDAYYPDGVKVVPVDVADRLTPLAMSVWYMDDGHYKWWHTRKGGYCEFCTDSFGEIGNATLIDALQNRYGFRAWTVRTTTGTKRLILGKDDSTRFAALIRPYVHSTLVYKLPTH